ncbi:hypothetical protein DFH06DRAFT_1477058 [Mycena polygramma]|nr:hypothetical protein DFH06DRAFT_1477058 [Mycena polygramma]
MHPEFQLSKLSELSVSCRERFQHFPDVFPVANGVFSFQRVAILAADHSAPAEVVLNAVDKVQTMLAREADPLRSAQSLLPVVYANLDLRRLPDPDLLTADHPRVFAAVRALDFLKYCEPRLGCAITRELWPLVWEWAQFIDNHECFHKDQTCVRVQFLSFFALFLKDATTKQVVHETPDVRFFVARALSDLVALSERDGTVITSQFYSPAILSICHFLFACHDFPEHAEELVVGAGCDVGDLAHLLVRYMAVIVRGLGDNADGAVQERLLYTFHNVQQFMRLPIRITGGEPVLLWRSMASVGYLTVAVRALETLAAAGTIALARQTAALCLVQVHDIINSTLKACEIAEALGAGFLRALILCVAQLGTKDAFIFLLGSTLVHQCMSVLPAALADALELETIPGFVSSPCFEKWQVFKTTVMTHQQCFEEFSSFPSKRACDNFECDALMEEKTTIKCCSACRIALYCSQAPTAKPEGCNAPIRERYNVPIEHCRSHIRQIDLLSSDGLKVLCPPWSPSSNWPVRLRSGAGCAAQFTESRNAALLVIRDVSERTATKTSYTVDTVSSPAAPGALLDLFHDIGPRAGKTVTYPDNPTP